MLSGPGGEMALEQFEQAVRIRLRHYAGRVLAGRMAAAQNQGGGGEGGGGGGGTAEDSAAQLGVLKGLATAQERLEGAVAEIRQEGQPLLCLQKKARCASLFHFMSRT